MDTCFEDTLSLAPIYDALIEKGYCVLENYWPEAAVTACAAACQTIWAAQGFHPAVVGQGQQAQRLESLRSDQICWLEQGEVAAPLAQYLDFLEALRMGLNRNLMLGLADVEVMAACYPPGARYGRHFDRFKEDDARTVTAILYLNPHWGTEDGGALRAYLPDGGILDVPPQAGTLVLFMTEVLEHEVLVTNRQRLTLTAWFRRRSARLV